MPDCDYCEASFDDEEAYTAHLGAEHEGELGRIDRRRVEGTGDDGGLPTGPIVLGVILLAAAAIVGYTVFVAGGGGPQGIGPAGSAHYHGSINMTVTGDPVDFSQQKYQLQADRFHFEGGGRWHAHATGVTLGFAMDTLGINVTDDSVTFEGTTYVDGQGYEVVVQVDGSAVGPGYVLKRGDHIRIVVRET